MSKIRINDLARELEVKSKAILDALPLSESPRRRPIPVLSKTMKRKKCGPISAARPKRKRRLPRSARPLRGEEEIKTKIDLSHISKPGDVLKAITQQAGSGCARAPALRQSQPAVAPLHRRQDRQPRPSAACGSAIPPAPRRRSDAAGACASCAPRPSLHRRRAACRPAPAATPAAPPAPPVAVAPRPAAPPAGRRWFHRQRLQRPRLRPPLRRSLQRLLRALQPPAVAGPAAAACAAHDRSADRTASGVQGPPPRPVAPTAQTGAPRCRDHASRARTSSARPADFPASASAGARRRSAASVASGRAPSDASHALVAHGRASARRRSGSCRLRDQRVRAAVPVRHRAGRDSAMFRAA